MNFGLIKKRALVTGASRGIGKAIALALSKEGCCVSVVARHEKDLIDVVTEMGGESKGHNYYSSDLTLPYSSYYMTKCLGTNFDIIINNLGGNLNIKDIFSSFKDYKQVLEFNVGIAIDLNNLIIPSMKKNKWGRILHISSFSAETLSGSVPYILAKNYLNTYTKILGNTLAKDGIVVSALMPGAVIIPGGHWDENSENNKISAPGFIYKREDFLSSFQPIGRFAKPEEIANIAVFLVSEQASFMSASVISASGGGV